MAARILVIDDEQDACDLLTATLERQGMFVAACTSPRAALDRVAREDYDVVLTDLAMSEMGGIEVCQRIAGINPTLPVVVVTGQGGLETMVAAMRAGAFEFVTKPVDSKLLMQTVARAAQHHAQHVEVTRS